MFSIDNEFKSNNDGTWVGIDFGTTNSTMSMLDAKLHMSKRTRLSNMSHPNKNNTLKKIVLDNNEMVMIKRN